MAALTPTNLTELQPLGEYMIRTFTVTPGAGAADEWVAGSAIGFGELVAVLGVVTVGTAPNPTLPSIVLNARGTGVAAGTNPGDLGIEDTAGSIAFQVTVLGKV